MYYGNIKPYDIADGPGVRVSLFVSGCRHHCKGCFNAETWDFHYGQPYTKETEEEILSLLSPSYIQGFTLLGGEPFEPENQRELAHLLHRVREAFPGKDIWCYTRLYPGCGPGPRREGVYRSDGGDAVLYRPVGGRGIRGGEKGRDLKNSGEAKTRGSCGRRKRAAGRLTLFTVPRGSVEIRLQEERE